MLLQVFCSRDCTKKFVDFLGISQEVVVGPSFSDDVGTWNYSVVAVLNFGVL